MKKKNDHAHETNIYNWVFEGSYINTKEYPSTELRNCVCGNFVSGKNYKFCSKCGKNLEEIMPKRLEEYNKLKENYLIEEKIIFNRFKSDLAKHFEVENNPKFQRCFELAWEKGHSSGFSEVLSEFQDLVELIK